MNPCIILGQKLEGKGLAVGIISIKFFLFHFTFVAVATSNFQLANIFFTSV